MRRLRIYSPHCDRTLQLLLKTFFDLLLLRRGPDLVPHSGFLLIATFAASFVLSVAAIAVILPGQPLDIHVTLILMLVPIAYYYLVLSAVGRSPRFIQTMTAMFGADLLLTAAHLVIFVVISLSGDRNSALIITQLITLWSIPVQGHIIARAIERHWLVGVAIAMFGFILSLLTYSAIDSP